MLFGSLLHLFLAKGDYLWTSALVKTLWTQGRVLQCGGLASGALALGLSSLFSKIGAGLILVLGLLILFLTAFHISPVDIVRFFQDRPHREYEYEEEDLEPAPRIKERRGAAREAEPAAGAAAARRNVQIDIPVDDGPLVGKEPELPTPKKAGFFNRKARVPAPDQVLAGERRKACRPRSLYWQSQTKRSLRSPPWPFRLLRFQRRTPCRNPRPHPLCSCLKSNGSRPSPS